MSCADRPLAAVEENPRDLGGWTRMAKQVALHLYATQRLQRVKLLLRFDTFRGRIMSRFLARPAIACTIASGSAPLMRSWINERSILILSNGKLRR